MHLWRFPINPPRAGWCTWLLTFDFVLGLFSPPLELFAVVVEPLQAHDAVLQAGAARTQDTTQPSGGLRITGAGTLEGPCRGTPLPTHFPCAQRMLRCSTGSSQTQLKGKILARTWGTSLPFIVIPHSISFALFYLSESTSIQAMILGGWGEKGQPGHGGCSSLKGPDSPHGHRMEIRWDEPFFFFCLWFAPQPEESLLLSSFAEGAVLPTPAVPGAILQH